VGATVDQDMRDGRMKSASDAGIDEFHLTDHFQELKSRLHRHLIRVVEEESVPIEDWGMDMIRPFVERRLVEQIARERLAVNRRETDALLNEMLDELVGYGPLQRLIDDDAVSDILVNGPVDVFVERGGRLEPGSIRFIDARHLLRIIQKIIAPLGRRIDESSPMVDARLPDGSRVNAVIPPVALVGPILSIRKFRRTPLRDGDLLSLGALSEEMLNLLGAAVRSRCNLLVSGGTGAGKTTLLNVLAQSIPACERIVTIEDTAELRFDHPHVVAMETRPPNLEGSGEIDARALVRNALRMRPDRIIVGETRGSEVIEMLQAMNSGHQGSMSTIHANSPRDALSRIELLVGLAGFQGSERTLRQNVSSAIDLIVQADRLPSGQRKVVAISEIAGVADGQYQVHDLFRYDERKDAFARDVVQPSRARLRTAVSAPSRSPFRGLPYV
jgi:pilus assembly protein CpaF